MQKNPVVKGCSLCLAHVPDLVRHGSKPRREIARRPAEEDEMASSCRPFGEAARYAPNQVFVGNLDPEELRALPRPWFEAARQGPDANVEGRFGKILPQEEFYARLWEADVQEPRLFQVTGHGWEGISPFVGSGTARTPAVRGAFPAEDEITREVSNGGALAIMAEDELVGVMRRDGRAEGREDENLTAPILLENLCAKASGAVALRALLEREDLAPGEIDYVISCGEEACGDRYQRGGGGMAKAIAEQCGCTAASGMDIKNFCAGPASAIVTAGALVKAGLYERVVVVAGGSLAKLGMKYRAFLDRGMPVLDDCLASMAVLVTRDDGVSPVLRLEPGAVGISPVGSSTSEESVYRNYLLGPLQRLGLRIGDVDKFAPELHNPEIMEFAGSGDVVRKNYRTIAALAVMEGEIAKSDMNEFIERIGMPGFAPTQGHIPSAIPYLPHALEAMKAGDLSRVLFLGKASLFLNRCTELYDGVSFLLEANPR